MNHTRKTGMGFRVDWVKILALDGTEGQNTQNTTELHTGNNG